MLEKADLSKKLPEKQYWNEIKKWQVRLREQSMRLFNEKRMAVAPELTNTSFRTTLYASLVRAGLIIAHAGEADYGLISVNPSQVRFYEMMCGFKALARADDYPGINAPAVLMGRNFRALNARRIAQNPFFRFHQQHKWPGTKWKPMPLCILPPIPLPTWNGAMAMKVKTYLILHNWMPTNGQLH